MLTQEVIENSDSIPLEEWSNEQVRRQRIPNWQPRSFQWYFFVVPLFLQVIQFTLTAILLEAWYTESAVLLFNLHNTAVYMLWQFGPLTIAVCAGFFWEIIYLDVCQLEPFYQLTHPDGVALRDSLSLDYSTSFTWFVLFKSFCRRPRRHTAVGLASLNYILVVMVLPTFTTAMLKVRWLPSTVDAVAVVLPPFAILNLVVLGISIVCGVSLHVLLRGRRTGLYSAPTSISGIASLVSGSNLLEPFDNLQSCDSQGRIDQVLGRHRLRLDHVHDRDTSVAYQICLLDPASDFTIPQEGPIKPTRAEAHSWWLWGRTYVGFSLLILVLFILLYAIPSIGDHTITILTAITTISTAVLWSNWHTNLAILEPYYRLSKGKTMAHRTSEVSDTERRIVHRKGRIPDGTSNAMHLGYTSSAVSNLLSSMRKETKSMFVGYHAFCVWILQLSIISTPAYYNITSLIEALAIQSAIDKITRPNYTADQPVVPRGLLIFWWASLTFLIFQCVLLFISLVMILLFKRKPIMPRKPYTPSSVILYLCNSVRLLDDLAGTSMMSKEARDDHLKQKGGIYGLGWVRDDGGRKRLAIERVEEIESGYIFGEALTEQAR